MKLLIIGKNSFIGSNIYNFFKKIKGVRIINFNDFLSKNINYLNKFDYLINCSISQKYIIHKYESKNDFDFIIAKKIAKSNIHYIFLSTRKVYESKFNITENSITKPSCNYSQNKLKTEKKLLKIFKKRLTILRISNLIGLPIKKANNKSHFTFMDYFFENTKNKIIFNNGNTYKDFISIDKFSEIIAQIIKNKLSGIYNVSLGKKIYINTLINWLNYYNKEASSYQKIEKKYDKDCFTLNNNKLMKDIKLKNTIIDLQNYCKKISKKYFKK